EQVDEEMARRNCNQRSRPAGNTDCQEKQQIGYRPKTHIPSQKQDVVEEFLSSL
ncbi:Hypothetical protein SMAX5B_007632, partial [Scophthalmus maximus]